MTRKFLIRRCGNPAKFILACVALIAALGASCGQSDSSDSGSSLTSDASASDTFSTLLGHIPDNSEIDGVYVVDSARVRELYHIALPETDDAAREYLRSLADGRIPGVDSAFLSWLGFFDYPYESSSEVKDYLAFDARNADSSIIARVENHPKVLFEVARGRYDPDATRRALARCSDECLPFTLDIHEGVEFYIWGEDYADSGLRSRMMPPLFDPSGRNAARIGVTESRVYRTSGTQDMRDIISAASGSARSLADDGDMALAANGLDRLGAYVGSIRRNVERFSARRNCPDLSESECVREMEGKPGGLLDEYEVLGVGFGKDEDGPFIGVALVYKDEDVAIENATVFADILESGESPDHSGNAPWREVFPSAEVKSESRAVTARLSVTNPYHSALWSVIYDDVGLFDYR